MKYRITLEQVKPAFVPFSVTITCETAEDARALHDLAAIKLARPGDFIRDCYLASQGDLTEGQQGTIYAKS